MITATHWKVEEIEEMPFCDAAELFDYWAECPPVHLLMKWSLKYEGQRTTDVMETAQAIQILSGGQHAQKLSSASEREQQIFADLKQELKKRA